jgi:hypothetical protein
MRRLTALRLAVAATLIAAFSGAALIASHKSAATMQKAATQFLDSLSADQKARATFPFEGEERLRWHFIPNEMFPRKGLMIKDMNETQRALAFDLLRSGLSSRGFVKVRAIMELEDVLKAIEVGGKMARNKEEYLFSIFGTPAAAGTWGWRVEGHHISIRLNVVDGAARQPVATSPMFLGANPAIVQEGDQKGRAALHSEENAARAFLATLSGDLQARAIANAIAPSDILTMNKNDIAPLPDQGVTFASLDATQRAKLLELIAVYTDNMETDLATERMARIKAGGLDAIRFAWMGETEQGKKHYYLVQGPTFLIEYDNTQNNGNHIHSVWRDFNGDFGRDILRQHLKEVVH